PNNPVGEGRWFYQFEENGPFPWQDGFSNPGYIPKHAFTDDYNLDSLVNVKLAIKNYYLSNDSLEKLNHQNYIISKMDIYTKSFKRNKPIYSYIIAPMRLLNKFLLHSGSYNLTYQPFTLLPISIKLIKLFWEIMYFSVLVLFGFSLFWVHQKIIPFNPAFILVF